LLQVLRAGLDILIRVECVAHLKLLDRRRHELHQPTRAFAGHRTGPEAGLLQHDRAQQLQIELVRARRGAQER